MANKQEITPKKAIATFISACIGVAIAMFIILNLS